MYYAKYYVDTDNIEYAIRYYKLASNKGCIEASRKLGIYYENIKDYANMEIYYNLAKDSYSVIQLARYYKDKNIQNMIYCYNLGMDKGNVNAAIELGLYYRVNNEVMQMLNCYITGLRIDPNNATLLYNMGCYFVSVHNENIAEKYFEMASSGGNDDAKIQLGCHLIDKRNYVKAYELLSKCEENNSKAAVFKGHCAFLMNNYTDAQKFYKIAYDSNDLSHNCQNSLKKYINEYLDVYFDISLAYKCKKFLNEQNKKKLDISISSHIQFLENNIIKVEKDQCCICLEDKYLQKLECDHAICTHCYSRVCKCPLCRKSK